MRTTRGLSFKTMDITYKLLDNFLDEHSLYRMKISTIRPLEHLYGFILILDEKQYKLFKRRDLVVDDTIEGPVEFLQELRDKYQIIDWVILDEETRPLIDLGDRTLDDMFIRLSEKVFLLPLIIL